jgi:mRNA interferase RelE/StbE
VARYEVLIKTSAAKEIDDIPNRKDRRRIVERIRSLEDEPRPPGCQKLSGQDRYRVRQGVYRIVYSIEDEKLVVQVVKVGHRKDVYRG